MVRLITSLSLILWTTTVAAEEVLHEIAWAEVWKPGQVLTSQGSGAEAEVVGEHFCVRNDSGEPATVLALRLDKPGITTARWAIQGEVRYGGVEGGGYLEMWSCFGGNNRYFTRTLGESGPMAALTGSSDWRPFALPCLSKEGAPPPTSLIVNVVLPGSGKVWLSPLKVVQFGPDEDPLVAPGQWWSDRMGGLVGGIFGALVGLLGVAVWVMTSMGKARSIVFAMIWTTVILGGTALVAGIIAVIGSQPYGVYYPLLLIGILCPALGLGITPTIRRRFDEMELRKMAAMDAV